MPPSEPIDTQWIRIRRERPTASWSIRVPADASLVGIVLDQQGVIVNAGANHAFGTALSRAGEATVGMR